MKHLLILIIVINNSCSCQSSLNNFEFKLYKLLVADTLSNSLFKEIQIESKNLYFRKNLSEVFVKTTKPCPKIGTSKAIIALFVRCLFVPVLL